MSKAKVKVLTNQTYRMASEKEIIEKKARVREAQSGDTIPERLAGDSFAVKNHYFKKAKELFPLEWRMQFAEICYPYSPEGPLFVDFPSNLYDISLCERKAKVVRPLGVRYVYLTQGMNENEAREQMEQFK